MTARTWTATDPEPSPWPTVVDEDGVTWRPDDVDGLGYLSYRQQKIVHHGTWATAGLLASDWRRTSGTTCRWARSCVRPRRRRP
jgi:hypothetical protein